MASMNVIVAGSITVKGKLFLWVADKVPRPKWLRDALLTIVTRIPLSWCNAYCRAFRQSKGIKAP